MAYIVTFGDLEQAKKLIEENSGKKVHTFNMAPEKVKGIYCGQTLFFYLSETSMFNKEERYSFLSINQYISKLKSQQL